MQDILFCSNSSLQRRSITFFNRYAQVLIEVTTTNSEVVAKKYQEAFRHGMSIIEAQGAYGHQTVHLCKTVVSTYEAQEAVRIILKADPNALIYTHKIDNFYGKFYRRPIE